MDTQSSDNLLRGDTPNDNISRVPTVREKSGEKSKKFKVREKSGKFEILAKVREKSGNFRIKSQTIFFSDDNYSYKSINSNDFQLLGELCYS